MDLQRYENSPFKGNVEETVKFAQSLRTDRNSPVDASFQEVLNGRFAENPINKDEELTFSTFLESLGIDTEVDTIENLYTMPDSDIRWVVPEIVREALLLGLRTNPIWSSLIASEAQIDGLKAIMPHINMSDATPKKVNEGETIPLGTISYGQKDIKLFKMGRGIKLSREVQQYVSLDVLAIFLRDFGVKLGHGLDVLAIDCLINGEQADGSESAPVIGVTSAGTKAYKDMLRIWIRLSRLGRKASVIVGGEDAALETLDMDEFKLRHSGTPDHTLNVKTPVPSNSDYYIHGNVPTDQEIFVDPSMAMIKFNAQPLLLEAEKIVSNQTDAFYVTLTTGFAKIMRDAVVILDKSDTIVNLPFPAWMDVDITQNVLIE